MVKPTHDEIIRELSRDVAILKEQMQTVRVDTAPLPDLTIRLALLEQQVQTMRQGWERWLQRAWMVLAPLVGVAAGALLTYYFSIKK